MPISFLLTFFIWIQHDWMPVSGQHDRSHLIKLDFSQSTLPNTWQIQSEAGKTTMGKKREKENIGYFRCNKFLIAFCPEKKEKETKNIFFGLKPSCEQSTS